METTATAAVSDTAPDKEEEASRKRPRDFSSAEEDSTKSKFCDPSKLPPELASVDFSKRITWGKYAPYTDVKLPLVPVGTAPVYAKDSPALCHHVNGLSKRARACTIHLKPQKGQLGKKSRPVPTPMFMPVGTKGCLKGISIEELVNDPALQCPIILANTYHMAIQPGTELVRDMGGLHSFQGLDKCETENSYNLLTDSGGFQMVSLVKLSQVTEEGVSFQNPFQQDDDKKKDMLLLRPEDSIRHQNNIGANIIMALDDVISSVATDDERFLTATHRTLRWYDRCIEAHAKPDTQNLFPIVQGGLDVQFGGLREQCLAGFRERQLERGYQIPGYAIGGLAGGEEKDCFWRVIDQCCRALPDDKPRYLMGVGYPLDLVVCTALGVDLFDCVYPTRTARFGVALVKSSASSPGGILKVKAHACNGDSSVLQEGCPCQACRLGISRSRLHALHKAGNPVAVQLITQHNLAYMMALVRDMRNAILEDRFATFAIDFVREQHFANEEIPSWVVDALAAAGIDVRA
jgi:tRNA-guanine transglycosylase